jgi:hypothetical protein
MIGKFLSLPFKVLNAPFRATEKLLAGMCGESDIQKENRIISKPIEEIDQ